MLNQFYRFALMNNTGQTNTFTDGGVVALSIYGVIVTPSTGKLAYATIDASEDFAGFTAGGHTWSDGAEKISVAAIDNTTNLYINALVQLTISHSEAAAAVGSWDLYLLSGDAAANMENDSNGYVSAEANKLTFIGSLNWLTGGTNDDEQMSPVFTI